MERAKHKILRLGIEHQISFVKQSLENFKFDKKAQAVLCHYTLQFVDPVLRPKILQDIFEVLEPGGVLILSEKTCSLDEKLESILKSRYRRFKLENGYSAEEIDRKDLALQGFLRPWSLAKYSDILGEIGFSKPEILQKSFQFATMIVLKPAPAVHTNV